MISDHILSYFQHLEGCWPISCILEGFVDNINDIWIHPLGVDLQFCLKSGGNVVSERPRGGVLSSDSDDNPTSDAV